MIDRYHLACQPVRDLLVDYLRERQPALDHSTLQQLGYELGKLFWADIEQHHPGICGIHLPDDVARAWKQRLQVKDGSGGAAQAGTERISARHCLTIVRAFYLDIAQWALDDPSRWARWAVPCPVRPQEITSRKTAQHRKSRMDARTRERLPVLPPGQRHRPAEDQHVVQALAAQCSHESLGECVRPRRPDRCLDHPRAVAGEDVVEGGGELAVPVADQEPEPARRARRGP